MNRSVFEYYQKEPGGIFSDVIILGNRSVYSYQQLVEKTKLFPKAWFELSKLTASDKIEFSREFCLKTLPYVPHIYKAVFNFFSKMEDVCIILTKKQDDEKYDVQLVYSMDNDSVFFRGYPPLTDEQINDVNESFQGMFPSDFKTFLKIHSSFAKNSDSGIINAHQMKDLTNHMQNLIEQEKKVILCDKKAIDPNDLIFFYQSYQNVSFQCFYTRWIPFSHAGNVYFSYNEGNISNYHDKDMLYENMAFPTFLDWFIFYLEIMDVR